MNRMARMSLLTAVLAVLVLGFAPHATAQWYCYSYNGQVSCGATYTFNYTFTPGGLPTQRTGFSADRTTTSMMHSCEGPFANAPWCKATVKPMVNPEDIVVPVPDPAPAPPAEVPPIDPEGSVCQTVPISQRKVIGIFNPNSDYAVQTNARYIAENYGRAATGSVNEGIDFTFASKEWLANHNANSVFGGPSPGRAFPAATAQQSQQAAAIARANVVRVGRQPAGAPTAPPPPGNFWEGPWTVSRSLFVPLQVAGAAAGGYAFGSILDRHIQNPNVVRTFEDTAILIATTGTGIPLDQIAGAALSDGVDQSISDCKGGAPAQ